MAITTSDYLNQLITDKQDLVDNLTEQGIEGLTGDETFTELVPKVLDIQTGGGDLDWDALGLQSFEDYSTENYQEAEELHDNWDSSITSMNYKYQKSNIAFFPKVDTSNVLMATRAFESAFSLLFVSDIIAPNCTSINNCFNGAYSL